MNLFTKQKQTHRLREQIYGCQRGRVRWRDSKRVWKGHVHTAIFKMDTQQRTYWIAHGTLLNVMCQPAGERDLGENGRMYMYG